MSISDLLLFFDNPKFKDKANRFISEKKLKQLSKEDYFLYEKYEKNIKILNTELYFFPESFNLNKKIAFIRAGLSGPNDLLCSIPDCKNIKGWNSSSTKFKSLCPDCIKNKEIFHKFRGERVQEAAYAKYGVNSIFALPEIQKKLKDTNLKKYGVLNPIQNEKIQNKVKVTNCKRYGFENAMSNPEIRVKVKETLMKKYGVEHALQYPDFKEKCKQTNHERYGGKHYSQTEECKAKKRKNSWLNYGTDTYSQAHYNIENYRKLSAEYIETNFIDNDGYLKLEEFKTFVGCGDTTAYKTCHRFEVEFKHKKGRSRFEDKIIELIKSLDPDAEIITNSKQIITPKELDIHLPEYHLAIEANGLVFHSEGTNEWSAINTPEHNPNRHLSKLEACLDQNVDLIQIPIEICTSDPKIASDFEKTIAYKMGQLSWPTNQRWYPQEVTWDLTFGLPTHLLELGFNPIRQSAPKEHWFKLNNPGKILEEGSLVAGHRRYYDCGYLTLKIQP